MQTFLTDEVKNTPQGQEADAILRSCVHCGFCTATCPTYQLLGDELDGPRGRIYLIKQVLEGQPVTEKTQLHLDRCLTCRACETTCPSGVQYGRLADIGREIVAEQVPRSFTERLARRALRALLPYPTRFNTFLRLGQAVQPLLPRAIKDKVPSPQQTGPWPLPRHARKVILHQGCVQPGATPATNAAAARVMNRLGISAMAETGDNCCGAISYHLGAHEEGLDFMRRNIDAWWPHIEAGAEAVVSAASGCGVMIKDYGTLLRHDPRYADKAATVAGLARDLSEIIGKEDLSPFTGQPREDKVAFHPPCTLQHGQKINGSIETILSGLGYQLTPVRDAHLCCGSAGTYSLLQRDLSQQLLDNKLAALEGGAPDTIATANVGCQLHLATRSSVPVRHWIELLDPGS